MTKRGQITIFIIIGIIILFVVALGVYLKDSFNTVRPPVQQLIVSDELKPIQAYVTSCLSATSKDALIRLGQSGGYIEVPNGLKVNLAKPYDSEAFFFDPEVMPYWYYAKPCDNLICPFKNNPPLCKSGDSCALPYRGKGSVEEQLNTFIESNVNTCLNGLNSFNDRYDISYGKISVDSRIAESGVGFKMNYPLTIKVKGSTVEGKMDYVYTEHDLKLKEIYSFALEIRDAEANYTFLERNTLNLISAYSGVDSDKLPPMSGLELFMNGKKYWLRSDIKAKLMSDILPYTMLLQISNAGNAKKILPRGTNPDYLPFEEGLYNAMMIKVSDKPHFDLDANIYYPPDADIFFSIGNKELIKPKTFDVGDNFLAKMMNFAANDYSFKYDLTYPVVVKITDPEAFNGEGYTFNYAMQANIRKNVAVTENMTVIDLGTPIPTIDMDNPTLRVNRTITIDSYDKYTKNALEGVKISYKCGYEVTIGETVLKNGKATLKDKFPFCEIGGEIIYEKDGYMGSVIDFSNTEITKDTDPKNFRIELWPLQEKKFKVYKRTEADINRVRAVGAGGIVLYNTAYTPLNANDSVFVNIIRVKNDIRESDVPVVGFAMVKAQNSTFKTITPQDQRDYVNQMFTSGQINESVKNEMLNDLNFQDSTPQTIEVQVEEYAMDFVPGTYIYDAFMMYGGNLQIPESVTKICPFPEVLGVCPVGQQEMKFPAQNFSSWITGGGNINFTLTENDVYSNNTLIFYVLEMPLPDTWQMIEATPEISVYQQSKLTFLLPSVERK